MALALFDLDNTLIAGDSDHGWGEFLCRHGYVDADAYRRANDAFYAQYERGEMDIYEYLSFSFQPLVDNSAEQLEQWHRQFMAEVVEPMFLPKAQELVESHRQQGDTLVVITSTNRFIVAPIVAKLGIEHLLATEAEMVDGCYTGAVDGVPCYREGKIDKIQSWLRGRDESLARAYFYSDSINDLPLMAEVSDPVAVDPDSSLRAEAEARGWPVISLR